MQEKLITRPMTTTNGNGYESRLSAIESILQNVAVSLQSITQHQETLTERQEQFQADLTRLEQAQERSQQQIQEATALANSNARSIEAWEALIEQNKVEAEEERSELKVAVRELIRANQQNIIEHELFRRRIEAIEQGLGGS